MKHIYDLGIRPEWWQLAPLPPQAWAAVDALIIERDTYCRGVLLRLDAAVDEFATAFAAAARSRSCSGYAIGRDILVEPARAWLRNDIDDATLVARIGDRFAEIAGLWRAARNAVSPTPHGWAGVGA
jgi:5-dehydro-2-deoxygluconokinase